MKSKKIIKESPRFTLAKEDLQKWGQNIGVFAIPFTLAGLSGLIPTFKEVYSDSPELLAVVMFVLNGLTDLLVKWSKSSKYSK